MEPLLKDCYSYPKIYPKDTEIGIEIEMEGRRLGIKDNKTWLQKGDGSLRGTENIEYITHGAVKLKDVPKTLDKLLTLTAETNARFQPSDRCGVHIHINCQHLCFSEVFMFMFLYLVLEKVMVGYCGESREGNLFCLRSVDAEYMIDKMIECKRESDLDYLVPNRDLTRYASVNPGALYKFGSLEFRSLKTPKNFMEIDLWARLLHRIKEASLDFAEPGDVIEQYSMLGENHFLDAIMTKEYADILRKKVPDVDQKVLDGIRLTQDIAYTPTINNPETKTKKKKKKKIGRSPVFNNAIDNELTPPVWTSTAPNQSLEAIETQAEHQDRALRSQQQYETMQRRREARER